MADSIIKSNTASDKEKLKDPDDVRSIANDGSGPGVKPPSVVTDMAEFDKDTDLEEIEARKKIANFMQLPEKEREAKMAVVLERGIINDRLTIPNVPSDLHYEWVRNDPQEVDRMRALGFWVDNNYANKRSLNSDGTSANVIGDTIAMMTTRDNKNLNDKARENSSISSTRNPREDKELKDNVARETGNVIPTFSESTQRPVTTDDIRKIVQNKE